MAATCVVLLACAIDGLGTLPVRAQVSAEAEIAVMDPIRCWWRSSAGAVRVGEVFDVVLTCAALENDAMTVVPDRSRLEPSVAQIPPFEVTGGSQPSDVRTANRRFFQYVYTLRLLQDDGFDQDVALPALEIAYRIESRVEGGVAVEGRDRTYTLPQLFLRVLSLVPSGVSDIRDAGGASFADVEARLLRSRMLFVLGSLFFVVGMLLAVATLVRLPGARRLATQRRTALLSDRAVLGGVARELRAIREARNEHGWTSELAGRTLAACRIAASHALSMQVSRRPSPDGHREDGQLLLGRGWPNWTSVLVSGSATADAVEAAMSRTAPPAGETPDVDRLETLRTTLSRLTAARYGRDDEQDEVALDESIGALGEIVRRQRVEGSWPVRAFRRVARSVSRWRRPV